MQLDPSDQTALLDVIEEYFTQPFPADESEESSSEGETCETETEPIGV